MQNLLPDGTQDISVCQPISEGKNSVYPDVLPNYNYVHYCSTFLLHTYYVNLT